MTTAIKPGPVLELAPYKSMGNDELSRRIAAVRAAMGRELIVLGHHYQQDEVIAFADLRRTAGRLGQRVR